MMDEARRNEITEERLEEAEKDRDRLQAVYVEALDEVSRLQDALSVTEADIRAYRGALGYPVPGDHDGRLRDGTYPVNGTAVALEVQLRDALSVLNAEPVKEGRR